MATPFLALADDGGDSKSGRTDIGSEIRDAGIKIREAATVRIGEKNGSDSKDNSNKENEIEHASSTEDRSNDRIEKQNEHASSTVARLEDRGTKEVENRITSLTKLMERIADFQRLTSDQKVSLSATITAEIAKLTDLKAKIAVETDPTTLKEEVQSVAKASRTYALVMPQAQISAASDRILEVVSQMQAVGVKVQARITAAAAAAAGADVTAAQSAYTDMQAKLFDASVQAKAAATAVADLKADNGDKTVFTANEAALKTARGQLKAAEVDLKAARADVSIILKAIKGKGIEVTASTTESR